MRKVNWYVNEPDMYNTKVHDAMPDDFPVRGGDDAIRLEELVNSEIEITNDTFALHRDVTLKKPLKVTNSVFKSTVNGEKRVVTCESEGNEMLRTLLFSIEMEGRFTKAHLILHKP